MRFTHRGSRLVRPTRRRLVWATRGPVSTSPAAGASQSFDLLAAFATGGASTLGVTVMRTHLHVAIAWGVGSTTSYLQYGLAIGNDLDVINARPNASNEPDIDWMLLDIEWIQYDAAAVRSLTDFRIDNRSKRKMEEMNQRYVLNIVNNAANQITVTVFSRVLVALP